MRRILHFLANPRLWFLFAFFSAALLVLALALCAPQQVPVAAYKLCLLLLAGLAGYCLDRTLFPYAEPSSYLLKDWRKEPHSDVPFGPDFAVVKDCYWLFVAASLRQALIIAVSMLAVGLGL